MRSSPRRALRAAVRRLPEPVLERTLGGPRALGLLFDALARRFDPAAAGGFTGDLAFALTTRDGARRDWTVTVGPDGRARARRGPSAAPSLTVRSGVADLLRMAAGEVDPGSALLDGRLDLEGDFAVATRAAAMFGLRSPF